MPEASTALAPADLVKAHWKTLTSLDLTGEPVSVDAYSRLIPAPECNAIIAAISRSLEPMPTEEAPGFVRLIMGAYADQGGGDPDTYVRMLATAMARCPKALAMEVVDLVTRRHPRFKPSKGELEIVIEELCRNRRQAIKAARKHLAEWERRAGGANRGRLIKDMADDEREKFFADLRAKYPEGFGMVDRVAKVSA